MLGMLPLCAQEAEDTMVPGQILAAILALEIQHAEIQDTSIEVLSAQSGGLHGGSVRNDGLHALRDGAHGIPQKVHVDILDAGPRQRA